MTAAQIKEIRHRFEQAAKRHMANWDSAHSVPKPPSEEVLLDELRSGDFKVQPEGLKDFYRKPTDWHHGEPLLFEVVVTPSFANFLRDSKAHQGARTAFEEAVKEAQAAHLDRVLFDHENAFAMLQSFQNWEAGSDNWRKRV